MARRAVFLLLLLAVALAWTMEGVRGEGDDLGEALEAQGVQDRSSFVRRQLSGGGRGSSCSRNKAVCTKSPYPAGWQCCGDSCTSVQTDYNNCGWCGRQCGWSQTCCAGECVYLSSDNSNCGRCGNKCPKGGCKFGVCRYTSGGRS